MDFGDDDDLFGREPLAEGLDAEEQAEPAAVLRAPSLTGGSTHEDPLPDPVPHASTPTLGLSRVASGTGSQMGLGAAPDPFALTEQGAAPNATLTDGLGPRPASRCAVGLAPRAWLTVSSAATPALPCPTY